MQRNRRVIPIKTAEKRDPNELGPGVDRNARKVSGTPPPVQKTEYWNSPSGRPSSRPNTNYSGDISPPYNNRSDEIPNVVRTYSAILQKNDQPQETAPRHQNTLHQSFFVTYVVFDLNRGEDSPQFNYTSDSFDTLRGSGNGIDNAKRGIEDAVNNRIDEANKLLRKEPRNNSVGIHVSTTNPRADLVKIVNELSPKEYDTSLSGYTSRTFKYNLP